MVENNSHDHMGRTREGMESGIEALKKALEGGYPNIIEIYKLLGHAYYEMAELYTRRNPTEEEMYWQKRKEVYDILLKIAPDDPDVLDQYAMWYVEDKAQQIAMYRRIIELDQKRVNVRFVLGMLLLETGSVDEGISRVGEAIAMESHFSGVRNEVTRLVEALSVRGCPLAGERAIKKKVYAMERNQHSSNDDLRKQAVEDMAQFKREIAGKLAKHKCLVKKK